MTNLELLTALREARIATVDDLKKLEVLLLTALRVDGIEPLEEMDTSANTTALSAVDSKTMQITRQHMKEALAHAAWKRIKRLQLTQQDAGERIGMPRQKVSAMTRGRVDGITERKLIEALLKLGCDIEIVVRPGTGKVTVESQ